MDVHGIDCIKTKRFHNLGFLLGGRICNFGFNCIHWFGLVFGSGLGKGILCFIVCCWLPGYFYFYFYSHLFSSHIRYGLRR